MLYNALDFYLTLGDYINSKEYRKPEWVTHMEEIQKRLSGEYICFSYFFSNTHNGKKKIPSNVLEGIIFIS